jgi:translation initiation factor IF-1
MLHQPKNICVGWQVEKKAGGLKGVVIGAVGNGKWKVRLDDGTVEELKIPNAEEGQVHWRE